MRRLALALGVVLALASPASATQFDFSWSSEVTGRGLDPVTGDFTSVQQTLGGSGPLTLSSTPSSAVLDFSTQVGDAHVELSRALNFGMAQNTLLPFDAPPSLRGGAGPGLYPSDGGQFVTDYEFVGSADQPTSFVLRAVQPGSTVAPEFFFVGTGTRTVSGTEPGAGLFASAALVMLAVAVRRRRQASGARDRLASSAPPSATRSSVA